MARPGAAIYWHFAYRLVDGEPLPQPYPCACLEPEHDDLMQWVGNYPTDHRPAPTQLEGVDVVAFNGGGCDR